ncbi:MAG: hypothetical protein [Bacteriophage sp.]|nr:MAG: hypothetical protein [Bacteriophage sp.]
MPTRPKNYVLTNVSKDVINGIINEGFSTNYKNYIPFTATDADSIRAIGKIIMDSPNLRNAFATDLINRIILVTVTSKMYNNPWESLKKGVLSLGETIEEIFVNIANAELYNPNISSETVFKRRIPDIRAAFHIVNYQVKYPATISNEDLSAAFTSENGLYSLIEKIYESLVSASNYDEFNIMKYLIALNIVNGNIKAISVPAISTDANIRSVVTQIKATSNKMKFMTADYNIAGVKTHSQHVNQTVIVTADFDAAIDVNVLAAAFNMEKAEFLSKRLLVDSFGDIDINRLAQCAPETCENITYDANGNVTSATLKGITTEQLVELSEIPAVIIDDDFLQIYDRLITMEDIRNPDGLYTNAFLHCWKIISVSPFAPAATFSDSVAAVNTVTISPANATVVPNSEIQFNAKVSGTGFFNKSVTWTLKGANSSKTYVDVRGTVFIGVDETATTITLNAKSNENPSKVATATITIYKGK